VARSRPLLALAIIGTIALGLASRRYPAFVPSFLGKYPGDGLWAMVVCWGIGWLRPSLRVSRVAVLALAVSYADEFSQLYQAHWINDVRSTTLGHLLLGSVFSWSDLLAYTFGVAISALLDRSALSRSR
jgi:hypothetical protein